MGEDPDAAWRPPAARPRTEQVDGLSGLVEIARGGDSVVYRAHQDALGRDVAVKVLEVDDPETLARFEREVRLTVDLGREHPNIVTVLDTRTTASGRPCLVMDLAERGSLADRLRAEGPLPVADVLAAGVVVADALDFAHGRGVLHRDVKPQNVLVLPTSYVLADFGIARLADSAHTASAERFSYRHASPQVLDGLPATVADDLWSLGSTLFTLLDGRAPFAAEDPDDDTPLAYLRRVRTGARRELTRTDLPPGLVEVVDRCLAPAREDRYGDARTVRDALDRARTGLLAWAPDAGPTPYDAAPAPLAAPAPVPAAPEPDHAPAEPVPAPAPEPAPRIAPPTPVPAAASALAHVAPTDPGPDGAPTGHLPSATSPAGGAPGVPALGAGASSRRRPSRRFVVAGASLLGIGLLAGAAYTVGTLRSPDPTPVAATPTTEGTTGTAVGPVTGAPGETSSGATAVPPVADPSLRPDILDLRSSGTAVTLTWSDPSKGKGTFVVTRTSPGQPQALRQLPPGVTTATIDGLTPGSGRVCYLVLVIVDGSTGVSAPRCTTL